MALFRTSLGIGIRNLRLFSMVAPRVSNFWYKKFRESPIFAGLETSSNLNNEQWSNLRKEVLESDMGVRQPALDTTIIRLCIIWKNLDLGRSYMKYLEENKHDINNVIIGKYLLLLYNSADSITRDDKKMILKICDDMRRTHPLLDALTAEYLILAISLTDRWKEALELLEMVRLSCAPSGIPFSAIITAAFNNNDPEIGWKFLNEIVSTGKFVFPETYISYLNYCLRNFKDNNICIDEIGKLLQFMGDHDLLPNETVVSKLKSTFKTLGWVGETTTLDDAGVCKNCAEKLGPLKLSDEDFSHLSKTVFDKVLVRNDVYQNSTPIELQKFAKFVEKTKPYHIVIDGLNVAYKNKKPGSHGAEQLAMVVRYFLDKNEIILILGRKHMTSWDKKLMNYIKNNCFLFLIDDISQDDPCLLYAALASGSDTKFVSSDLMRQHKFLLEDITLKKLFKRWQMSHQISFKFYRGKLSILPPLKYLPIAQQGKNHCWHVPYKPSDRVLKDSYEPTSTWLCLRKAKSRPG